MKILAIGDVVGEESIAYLERRLGKLRKEEAIDFCVANAENSAKQIGVDESGANRLFWAGVDVLTGGNHTWQGKNVCELLAENKNVLRPANYPGTAPGNGYVIFEHNQYRILVLNLLGTAFMEAVDHPFYCAKSILENEKDAFDFAIIDFHAEATAEKAALAQYLDSLFPKLAVFFGTHTHVPTADERILPGGTGFITDIGMCGPVDSVLGMDSDRAIERFLTKRPVRFQVASHGEWQCSGAVFEVDEKKGRCLSVKRVRF